jgi:hypothetical protein
MRSYIQKPKPTDTLLLLFSCMGIWIVIGFGVGDFFWTGRDPAWFTFLGGFVLCASWFVVRGLWFVVRGSWFVVRGSWFVFVVFVVVVV